MKRRKVKRYPELSWLSLRYVRGSLRAADWLQAHRIKSASLDWPEEILPMPDWQAGARALQLLWS